MTADVQLQSACQVLRFLDNQTFFTQRQQVLLLQQEQKPLVGATFAPAQATAVVHTQGPMHMQAQAKASETRSVVPASKPTSTV